MLLPQRALDEEDDEEEEEKEEGMDGGEGGRVGGGGAGVKGEIRIERHACRLAKRFALCRPSDAHVLSNKN